MRSSRPGDGILSGSDSGTEMDDLPRSRRPSVQDHGRISEQSRAADPALQKQDVETAPSHSHGDNSPFTSPTQDTALSDPGSSYQFRGLAARKTPAARLWLKCLARWLVTVVFIVAVYAVLIGYENYDVLSKVQKRQFSALITGFLIALGLITLSHLTSVAFDLRWWILHRKARSRRKVTYLLRCHSMSQLVMLALRSRRLTIHIFVAAWILLLLGSQIGYAALSLTYSVEKAEEKALLRAGNVSIPDMSDIETIRLVRSANSSLKAAQYTANTYGTTSLAYEQSTLDRIPSPATLWYQDDPLLFCSESSCSYVFHEINPETLYNPDAIPIVAATNRVVTASANCSSFPVIRGGDGKNDTITIRTGPGNNDVANISLVVIGGPDQSTFMTNPSENCGPGCSRIAVFEASTSDSWYYSCSSLLGDVTNAVLPQHRIGRVLERLATAGIALQGYDTTASRENDETTLRTAQAVIYPSETVYGLPLNGSVDLMSSVISRFTIGVVAITGEFNSAVVVPGKTPHLGQKLNIEHWDMVHLIFALTAGLQLLFALVVTWLMSRIVLPPGGAVDEAHILRPMMGSGPSMTYEKGSLPSNTSADKDAWIYLFHHVADGWYDLYMERVSREDLTMQEAETRQSLAQRRSGSSEASDRHVSDVGTGDRHGV